MVEGDRTEQVDLPGGRHSDTLLAEARSDVRSYATLILQVITLLLTTLILVVGWGAKDFVSEKYRVALLAAAPELSEKQMASNVQSGGPGSVPSAATPSASSYTPDELNARLGSVGVTFRNLLLSSPTTCLILWVFAFFSAAVMGVLVVLNYMLARRRLFSHEVLEAGGRRTSQPLEDPVLTSAPLSLLAGIVLVSAASFYIGAVWGTYHLYRAPRAPTSPIPTEVWVAVAVAALLASLKLACSGVLFVLHDRWAGREAWRLRWPRAHVLVEEIAMLSHDQPDYTDTVVTKVTRLRDICAVAADRARRFRFGDARLWPEATRLVKEIRRELRDTTLGSYLQCLLDELHATLRVRHWWQIWRWVLR